ncbi:MAG TPA: type II restriction endonuclease [Bacteroidales bacterium]
MNQITEQAISSVCSSQTAFCKFISANDAGTTGAHQSGFYIPKNSWLLMFNEPCEKGSNKDRYVKIKWQDDFVTESRFIYYGTASRNEYRLTRFGKGFPFLEDDNVGDLMILSHIEGDYYEGFVLQSDEDIEDFFAAFNISSELTNRLIEKTVQYNPEERLFTLFSDFVNTKADFPPTVEMALRARESFLTSYGITDSIIKKNPDEQLLCWLHAEYELFKAFEIKKYGERIKTPFSSVDELILFSNTILNRRKSRAGKSLEHHLEKVFTVANLQFESQVVTEDNKRPDFIFPGSKAYHDSAFSASNLVCLAAKTTCKDRWRQVINEADRIPVKHLFTLQQGISKNQLAEMYSNNVQLVVPKPYLNSFDKSFQDRILTLDSFTSFVKVKQQG